MRRILVTGASGLVGNAFISAMPHDTELIILGRHVPSHCGPNVRLVEHDLRAPALPTLPLGIDTIVHLAQERDYRAFPEGGAHVFAVNTAATLQLLDWGRASGVRRFVLASTGGLYAPSRAPVTEESAVAISEGPLAFYFSTKQSAELIARCFREMMTIAVLRLFFVYGKGQAPTMLMPRLIASVREGRPIQLASQNGLIFNPIHASDAGAAVAAATKLDEHMLVNVGGGDVIAMRSLGEMIGRLVGRPAQFEIREDALPPSMAADITLMRRRLCPPSVSISEGLTEMIGLEPRS